MLLIMSDYALRYPNFAQLFFMPFANGWRISLDGVDTVIPNSQCNEHVVAPHGMFLALLPCSRLSKSI